MKNKKPNRKATSGFNQIPVSPIDVLVRKLDLLSCELETKWGTGVLHSLAASETVAKWLKVKDRLDVAIQESDYDDVKKYSEMLMRGWQKLEEEVIAAGHKHDAIDTIWFVASPQSGLDYIICKHELDSERMAVTYPHLCSQIYTLDGLAKMLDRGSLLNNLTSVEPILKELEVSKNRMAGPMPNDDLPPWE